MSLESRLRRLEEKAAAPMVSDDLPHGDRRDLAISLVLRYHILRCGTETRELLLQEPRDEHAINQILDGFIRCIARGEPCERCGRDIVTMWIDDTGGKVQFRGDALPRPITPDDMARMIAD